MTPEENVLAVLLATTADRLTQPDVQPDRGATGYGLRARAEVFDAVTDQARAAGRRDYQLRAAHAAAHNRRAAGERDLNTARTTEARRAAEIEIAWAEQELLALGPVARAEDRCQARQWLDHTRRDEEMEL